MIPYTVPDCQQALWVRKNLRFDQHGGLWTQRDPRLLFLAMLPHQRRQSFQKCSGRRSKNNKKRTLIGIGRMNQIEQSQHNRLDENMLHTRILFCLL